MLVIFRINYVLFIAHIFPLTLKHGVASSTEHEYFVPSKVKKWAADDFSKTISWLESQDEKVNCIALLTCQSCATNLLKKIEVLAPVLTIFLVMAAPFMCCAHTMKSYCCLVILYSNRKRFTP